MACNSSENEVYYRLPSKADQEFLSRISGQLENQTVAPGEPITKCEAPKNCIATEQRLIHTGNNGVINIENYGIINITNICKPRNSDPAGVESPDFTANNIAVNNNGGTVIIGDQISLGHKPNTTIRWLD